MGFVLIQKERPISFGSKMFNSAEKRYSTGDKETLAIVTALKKYWSYLKGSEVTVWTDHKPSLNYLTRKCNEMTGREARWWERMMKIMKMDHDKAGHYGAMI
jgi:hypothetical protein